MYGKNPIRKPVKGDGSILEVKQLFATIQGEGPLAGMPAVFIRLGGCNLACDFCDTDFEGFEAMGVGRIITRAKQLASSPLEGEQLRASPKDDARSVGGKSLKSTPHGSLRSPAPPQGGSYKLVVITGGEPFRQPIEKLCSMLLDEGFQVQIETNGTLYRPIDERVMIVCSPKVTNGGYHRLREDLLPKLQALKFIISANHPQYKKVEEVGQSDYGIPVYVQPMDEYDTQKNAANLANAKALALQHGYRLSVQLHKIIGVE